MEKKTEMMENASDKLMDFVQERESYVRGQYIYHAGDIIEKMGIVLGGSIQIEQNDFWGNRIILDKIEEGGFFAETYAITGEPSMVDVMVLEDGEIGFVNVSEIMQASNEQLRYRLSQILVYICSRKNLKLSQKILFTSPKTIRARLNSYLTYQSHLSGMKEFDIPFDRQQLADYLNLDRSAMSAELSKMTHEGLIETRKNHFILKK